MKHLPDENPGYVSVLSAFKELPPLTTCLEAAVFCLEGHIGTSREKAFSKAHDFFLEMSASDNNIQFDAAYMLSQHALGFRKLDADVAALLERVSEAKVNSIVRNGEDSVWVRRRSSKSVDDYHLATAIDCNCQYKVYVRDSLRLCVHMAIVRVIEQAFILLVKRNVERSDYE